MNEIVSWMKGNTIFSVIGFVGSLLTIYGAFRFIKSTKNKIKETEIGGNYTGGTKGSKSKSKTSNDVTKAKIGGNYIGGDDNS